MGVTYGFEGNGGSLYRVDVFESGKLTDGWYGSIGGFYRNRPTECEIRNIRPTSAAS